jgi:hypothetical protein
MYSGQQGLFTRLILHTQQLSGLGRDSVQGHWQRRHYGLGAWARDKRQNGGENFYFL